MQLSSLLTGTRHRLDEESPNSSHWSDERLTSFLNEGVGDEELRIPPALQPALASIYKQNLSNGVAEYTFSTDYVRLDAIKYKGKIALPVALSEINMLTDNVLQLPTDTHPRYMKYGSIITVYPTPVELTIDGLGIYVMGVPTQMSATTDIPQTPAFAHPWLILYATAVALDEDGDAQSVQIASKIMDQYLEKFKRFEPQPQGGR